MPDLTTEIQRISGSYERKLDDLHDDYAHTRMLWTELVVRVDRYHEKTSFHNPMTRSVTEGTAWVAKGGIHDQEKKFTIRRRSGLTT